MRINKLISTNGNVSLIEAVMPERGAVRVYVPTDALRGEYIDEFDVQSGIEYGVPWEEVLVTMMPEGAAARLAKLLRDDQLYTANDVRQAPAKVAAILQRLWQADASRILLLATRYEKGELK